MLRFRLVFLAVLGVLALQTARAEEVKIGVVDLQQALQSVEAGKKAKAQLEKEFNEKKRQLQTEEEAIKKLGEEFKKQSMVLSDDAKARKQTEIQERMLRFRELFGKSQMEIQNRERELTEPILKKLRAVIEDIAKKKSFRIILEKNENSVLYSLTSDDMTEEVIKAFNSAKNG
jgi:outer membrane protein